MMAAPTLRETKPASDARQEPHDDAALLARVARGDERAFATLYEAHRRPLFRLAYGVLLDAEEAREAVQEAFLRLFRAAADWEPRALVGTWLYRVVLNHCLGLKQRLLRFVRLGSPGERGVPATGSAEAQAEVGQAVTIALATLATLPMKQRAIACLFLESELPPAEIAPLVGMTPNATRVALHRALEKMRADLAAAGIDAPPAAEELVSMKEEN
jgi:RNA polymerase sigma-70 factor (ECF subfamily)